MGKWTSDSQIRSRDLECLISRSLGHFALGHRVSKVPLGWCGYSKVLLGDMWDDALFFGIFYNNDHPKFKTKSVEWFSRESENQLQVAVENFPDVLRPCSGYLKHSPTSYLYARKKLESYDTPIKRYQQKGGCFWKKKGGSFLLPLGPM